MCIECDCYKDISYQVPKWYPTQRHDGNPSATLGLGRKQVLSNRLVGTNVEACKISCPCITNLWSDSCNRYGWHMKNDSPCRNGRREDYKSLIVFITKYMITFYNSTYNLVTICHLKAANLTHRNDMTGCNSCKKI